MPVSNRHRRADRRVLLGLYAARLRRWAYDVLTVQPDPEPVVFDVWPLLFDGKAYRNSGPREGAHWGHHGPDRAYGYQDRSHVTVGAQRGVQG